MKAILIGDTVTCTVEGHTHYGKQGVVAASKHVAKGIEHQVVFPTRKWSLAEIEAGEDEAYRKKYGDDHIVWLLHNEIEKV